MARFTEEQLARKVGYSPEQLAHLNMDDAEWERNFAEARASHAETMHQIDMAKAEGLNAINATQFDPEVLAGARALHAQEPAGPTVPELIEKVLIPVREKFLAEFNSPAPAPAPTKVGENEAAFLKLIGKTNG